MCLISLYSLGQEKRLKFAGIELGADGIISEVLDHDFIRGEMAYYDGSVTSNLRGSIYKGYVGLKVESKSYNNKFGLSTGLRFTHINSSLGKDLWNSSSNYFYFMQSQTETTTEYLKVKALNQASDYIGIPINLKFYPFRQRLFTFYFKAGMEIDYLLNSNTDVVFVNDDMQRYSDDVKTKFGKPNILISTVNASAGVKIGKESKTNIGFEIGPSVFLNEKTSTLVKAYGGFGARFNIQIPL